MSIAKKGLSAIGRLIALGGLAGAFMLGMAGVVYMSLQGSEVKVPEVTGKSLNDSEKELALLGLKVKKRADRVSAETPGTVIEQLPKPGETVKTGQMILVVTSKGPENGVVPPTVKTSDEDDSDKIEEMITDKPKKPKANSNTSKKKADTSRDVNAVTGDTASNSGTGAPETNSNKTAPPASNSGEKSNKSTAPSGTTRLPNPGAKPGDTKAKPKP
ncbi:MAG TPA: PASTA domain-containing protein [Pyrinomonadaceae bacterium]|nr:PASTA domain-containing protein [Pyrinomonadaceae bacterium]